MDKIYYQPNHLWKGQKAMRKLKELRKEKLAVVKRWLSKEAIWHAYLLPLKHVNRSKASQRDASVRFAAYAK